MKYEIKHRYTGAVLWTAEIANLSSANLSHADLRGADLSHADLSHADLRDANLRGADLSHADLRGANLSSANLSHADLRGADLRGADLRDANLRGANLSSANLRGADLQNLISQRTIVPEGELVVWKRISSGVCKLLIPKEASRVGGVIGRKCRAEYAVVIEGSGRSQHDPSFVYTTGTTVHPDKWDANPLIECSHGIHFFLTKHEAENY